MVKVYIMGWDACAEDVQRRMDFSTLTGEDIYNPDAIYNTVEEARRAIYTDEIDEIADYSPDDTFWIVDENGQIEPA